MDQRQARAFHIAATTKLEPNNGRWRVPSQTGTGTYTVLVTRDGSWTCSCPDHEERLLACKHIMAVEITVQRESGRTKVTYTELVRVTYSQNWSAYNAAQTNEKAMFVKLLADLCRLVPSPPHVMGRPRLPLSDMTFAAIYRTYARCSARRFTSDLRDAEDKGLIERAPSFNSVLRYTREDDMTAVLTNLLELSSLPLRAVETQFAIDSSGFGTSNMRTWFSTKHGREVREREWRKVHAMCGTSTHIVTAAVVTPSASNDAPHLPELVATTAGNFPNVREVSADKGYLSRANADAIEKHGATPYIAFKSNTVEPPEGSAWARMYHLYAYQRDEFLTHYHRRSNVETVFSMVKAKFGDGLLGKTLTAQTNEVLGKFVAHNLCVLIQSFHELGIDPTFDSQSAPAQKLAVQSGF
ncbi:MAG TPA: transposase [Acidimicrobiales bacterium]